MKIENLFKEKYIQEVFQNIPQELKDPITPETVLRPGIERNREIIGEFLDQHLLPGSQIRGAENLKEFYDRSQNGESCLMLVEHVSNFDYPALFRLIERDPLLGAEVANSILPLQGLKLNDENPFISAFTCAYKTIAIFPSRSIDNVAEDEKEVLRKISTPINQMAMRHVTQKKHEGHSILLYPTGTRVREWDESSKKAVREVQSYLKTFNNLIFISVHGSCLLPSNSEKMLDDQLQKDIILFSVSSVKRGRAFYKEKQTLAPEGEDTRQFISQSVIDELDSLHESSNIYYKELKNKL